MTPRARLRCAASSILLVAVALVASPSASAEPIPAPVVTVDAAASGPVSGAATDTHATITITIRITSSPTAATVLTAPVPGTVDTGGVQVDGASAPAGTVSGDAGEGRTDVAVRLGAGATPATGGVLAVGTHTVTVPTDLAHRAGSTFTPVVTTTLDYLGAGGAAGRASDTVSIPLPDLAVSLPAGSGEDRILPLASGSEALFAAQVKPRGGAVAAATLTVVVPSGLRVETELGVIRATATSAGSLRCVTVSRNTLSCPLGRVAGTQIVIVPLEPTGAAPVGSTASVAVSALAASGLDATPADNTVRATVRFVPATRLRTSLTADRTEVEIGSKVKVTATVRNVGSYPAPDVLGLLVTGNSAPSTKSELHFRVTDFTGRAADLGEIGGSGPPVITGRATPTMRQATRLLGHRVAARRQAGKDKGDSITVLPWSVGTIAPRAARTAVLTLKALTPGKGRVVAIATSLPGLNPCLLEGDPVACPEVDRVTLTAVTSAGTDGSGAEGIAATGVPTEALAALAVLLLALGAAAQVAGSRGRVTAGHRGAAE